MQRNPGPEVIKLFPCSTQLSIKFFLHINLKMPTIVAILTCVRGKNSILGLSEPKKAKLLDIFMLITSKISCSTELSIEKSFVTSGPVISSLEPKAHRELSV